MLCCDLQESKAFFQVYDGAVYMYQVGAVPLSGTEVQLVRDLAPEALVLCLFDSVDELGQPWALESRLLLWLLWLLRLPCRRCACCAPRRCRLSTSTPQGRTYLCKKLDLDAKVAVVRPAEVKYYTK